MGTLQGERGALCRLQGDGISLLTGRKPDSSGWAGPGTYILILRLTEPRACCIGALGTYDLPAGYYLYVGSALGPGGLAGRVGRHLRRRVGAYCIRPLRWHIDYLLEIAEVFEVWAEPGTERMECAWARRLLEAGGRVIVPGFGASDCRCPAHLVYFDQDL